MRLVNIVLTFHVLSLRFGRFCVCNFCGGKICSQPYQISPNSFIPNDNKQTVTEQYLIDWELPSLRRAVNVQWSTKTNIPVLCHHQRRIWSFLSIVDDRSCALPEFIWNTSCYPCSMSSTLHSTNGIERNNNTDSFWSQCCRRLASRTMMLAK